VVLRRRVSWCACVAVLAVAVPFKSGAAPITISDTGSSIQINTDAGASVPGMFSWLVDTTEPRGQQMGQQWLYYRIGETGPESPISSMGTLNVTYTAANRVNLSYDNPLAYGISIDYLLTDQTAGDGSATLARTISLINHGDVSTDKVHLFMYSAFELLNSTAGQSLALQGTMFTRTGTQSMPGSTPIWNVQESASTANTLLLTGKSFQAASDGSILASLTDGNPTVLNNTPSASTLNGSGAIEYAFAFDYSGTSVKTGVGISDTLLLQVPEPSIGAFLGLAMAGLTLRRRGVRG
jgi:hypothetical protein